MILRFSTQPRLLPRDPDGLDSVRFQRLIPRWIQRYPHFIIFVCVPAIGISPRLRTLALRTIALQFQFRLFLQLEFSLLCPTWLRSHVRMLTICFLYWDAHTCVATFMHVPCIFMLGFCWAWAQISCTPSPSPFASLILTLTKINSHALALYHLHVHITSQKSSIPFKYFSNSIQHVHSTDMT